MTTLRIFGIADDSIVDGPGIRFAVFTQGCTHGCVGCHNPGAQTFGGGREATLEELERQIEANPLLAGITLTGGEPFEQAAPLRELAHWARARGLTVWAYSGYTFEELVSGTPSAEARELLTLVDVLVDGPYEAAQASHALTWRGSANQRIIDVPASLAAGEAVQVDRGVDRGTGLFVNPMCQSDVSTVTSP
ncbi:MAG: anaerobic ribonucleoside-triphosphate reductase activating protein [Coriobacteriales bacterium]|jgi:anaerobic ribonucleoside-triphosphate reductase activating protein|nr:anaerobic ribonucleoside-triphosphate reductase activating protein [Coriobacteriales bacterium]